MRQSMGQRMLLVVYTAVWLVLLMAVYWALAISARINIGHRHILPTYAPLYILAGAAVYWFFTRLRWVPVLTGLVLAAMTASWFRVNLRSSTASTALMRASTS